ncbi:hypothetical protein AVEN_239460-1 [Araneus ventricosus]|uniref:Uncharacterized protein n=1 Tax=Araneus ventricosus TaxID=182803 RepID=A0A4Y2N811_ARAVE|nr:hypothetical protein AVEN_239460-1 [Araneus ventricosus]
MQGNGRIVKTQQELKEAVFRNVAQHFIDYSWLCQRAFLAPRNEDVSVVNKQLLQELPSRVQVYISIDTTCDIKEAINFLAVSEHLWAIWSTFTYIRAKDLGTNNSSNS